MLGLARQIYPFPPSGAADAYVEDRKLFFGKILPLAVPGFDYFHHTLVRQDSEYEGILCHFRAASLWHPGVIRAWDVNTDIRSVLRCVSFLKEDEARIELIVQEWITYKQCADMAHCTGGMSAEQVTAFWEANSDVLVNFFEAAQDLILGQPLSAGAERVFSVLASSFTEEQCKALRDLVECVVMLRHNSRKFMRKAK